MRLEITPPHTISIDTETTGILPFCGDRPYAVSMCDEEGETRYYRWPVDPFTREVQYDLADLAEIEQVLRDRRYVKEFFNAKFDLRMLWMIPQLRDAVEHLINTRGFREVFFMAKLCYSQEPEGGYGLKPLARKYAGIPDDDLKALKAILAKARAHGRKQGWNLYDYGDNPAAADYWMVDLWDPSRTEVQDYAVLDAVRTRVLGQLYWEVMNDPNVKLHDPCLRKSYEIEMEAWQSVWEMELWGMPISRKECQKEYEISCDRADRNLAEIRSPQWINDPDFNPRSVKRLANYLYNEPEDGGLGLVVHQWTDKGQPSTSADALREHLDHPFVQVLMNYRSARKAADDFFGKYLWMMQPSEDSLAQKKGIFILHPQINQVGPVTGRTSSSDPNLQQVGDATKQYRGVNPVQARRPFCSIPGWTIYGNDWAQQEARIFADIGTIPEMFGPIMEGRDINTENTNRIWGGKGNPAAIRAMAQALELGRDEPTSEAVLRAWQDIGWNANKSRQGVYSTEAFFVAEKFLEQFEYKIVDAEKAIAKSSSRGRGKTVLFTVMYGGGPKALKGNLYCTWREAKQFYDDIHRAMPGIQVYMKQLIFEAKRDGHIYTAFGRRINVNPDEAYKCVDYKVQGTAADMLKKSMIELRQYFWSLGYQDKCRMMMPIHDELLFHIRKDTVTKALLRGIKAIMEDTTGSSLRVPMLTEFNRYPHNWAEPVKGIV